jgi:thiol-disulfide isomerase/thioredoxin
VSARHVAVIALALLAGTAGYVLHRHSERAAVAAVTAPATTVAAAPANPLAWSFSDLDGRPTRLESIPGRLRVLNFWATWCPPCLREIPAFTALQARFGARGLQFVGIALDRPEAVRPFLAERGVNYPVLVGDDDVVRFMQRLGNTVGGLPYTVVLGPDGTVALTHQGEWEAAEAEAALAALLAPP